MAFIIRLLAGSWLVWEKPAQVEIEPIAETTDKLIQKLSKVSQIGSMHKNEPVKTVGGNSRSRESHWLLVADGARKT